MENQIVEFEPITVAKGCILRCFRDDSKPEGDPDKYWTEAIADGKPDSETFDVGAHWHKNHDEVMEIIEGRMLWTLDGVEHLLTPESGRVLIRRRVVHAGKTFPGERTVAIERAVPNGNYKHLFFHDLFRDGQPPGLLLAMRSFWQGDGYIPLPGNSRLLDEAFMNVMGYIASFFAPRKVESVAEKIST